MNVYDIATSFMSTSSNLKGTVWQLPRLQHIQGRTPNPHPPSVLHPEQLFPSPFGHLYHPLWPHSSQILLKQSAWHSLFYTRIHQVTSTHKYNSMLFNNCLQTYIYIKKIKFPGVVFKCSGCCTMTILIIRAHTYLITLFLSHWTDQPMSEPWLLGK